MSQKQAPESIKRAQKALAQLKAETTADAFLQIQKQLPAYARKQESNGSLLSVAQLVKAVSDGSLSKHKPAKVTKTYENTLAAKKDKQACVIAAISVESGAIYTLPKDASPQFIEKLSQDHADLVTITSPYDATFIPRMGIAEIARTDNYKLYDFLYKAAGANGTQFEIKALDHAVKHQNTNMLTHIKSYFDKEKRTGPSQDFAYQVAVASAKHGHAKQCVETYKECAQMSKFVSDQTLDKLYFTASEHGQEDVLLALDTLENKSDPNGMGQKVMKHTCLVRACEQNMLRYFQNNMPTRNSDLEELCEVAINRRQFSVVDLILSKNEGLANQYARRTIPRFNLSQPPSAVETYILTKHAKNLPEMLDQFFKGHKGFDDSRVKIDHALNSAEKWVKKTKTLPPNRCKDYNPTILKPNTYRDVLKMFEKENIDKSGAEYYAFQISTLLRTTDRVLQYLEKWGNTETTQPLHDIVHDLDLPKEGAYDLKAWGDAVLQHGPKMTRLVAFADKLPEPLKSSDGKTYSFQNTLREVAKREYKQSETYPEISQYAFAAQYTEGDFEVAVDLLNEFNELSSKGTEVSRNIPDIRIEGSDFGRADYHFRKLEPGDIRAMFLGSITDCCQHVAGAGSECAEHGFTSEDGGFYVIAHNDTDKIIGQAWAWRGVEGELVLDSLEAKTGLVKAHEWQDILDHMTAQICTKENAHHKITALHVGDAGRTPQTLTADEKRVAAHPNDYNGYRDSHSQHRIWKR